MKPSIQVEGISKCYRVAARRQPYGSFREVVAGAASRAIGRLRGLHTTDDTEVWALKDISFQTEPGDMLGIIGRNGAGKSTLLKILSRITKPTSGRAELRGRVGSLLEVGTGFHSELSGRENIFLGGAILGMSRHEVASRFDEIVDFASVEQFIDEPVKHYSSGMYLRLAFAVAAHLPAEILLADEVLAVGDAGFQRKCLSTMDQIARQGRTVVFVSHNLGAVAELCQRTMLIDAGKLVALADTREVVAKYLDSFDQRQTEFRPPPIDKGIAIRHVSVCDSAGNAVGSVDHSSSFSVRIQFDVNRHMDDLSIGVSLTNQAGIRVIWSWAMFGATREPGSYFVEGEFPKAMLAPGRYYLDVDAEHYRIEVLHQLPACLTLDIVRAGTDYDESLPGWGVLMPDIEWQSGRLATSEQGRSC